MKTIQTRFPTLIASGFVALLCTLLGGGGASAQQEPPELVIVPAVITVNGPDQAESGSRVTYTIDYAFSAPHPERNQYRADFRSILDEAVDYVSFNVVSGDGECVHTADGPREILSCEIGSDAARSGRLAVQLEIDPDYVGPLDFEVFIAGTSIRFEDGSVLLKSTDVVSQLPDDLPQTGHGASAKTDYNRVVSLAVVGLLLTTVSASGLLGLFRRPAKTR